MRNNLLQNQEYLEKGRESLSNPSGMSYLGFQEKFIQEEDLVDEEEGEYSTVMEQMKFQKRITSYQVCSQSIDEEIMEETGFIETKEILKIRDFGNDYSDDETSFFEEKNRFRKQYGQIDRTMTPKVSEKEDDWTPINKPVDGDLISHLNLNSLKTEDFDKSFTVNTNLAKIINNHQNFEQSILQDSRSPNYVSKNSHVASNQLEHNLSQSSLMECKESAYVSVPENPKNPINDQTEMTYRSNYPYTSDNRAFLQKIALSHYSSEPRNVDNLGFFDYLDECRDQILVTWRLHQDIEYNEQLINFIGQKVEITPISRNSKKYFLILFCRKKDSYIGFG